MGYDYIKLDMDSYNRKDHFKYFSNMQYPYVGLTVNVDITEWKERMSSINAPFFLSFLYAVTNAANSVKEFRQRIVDGEIIQIEKCYSSYTVSLEDETYCYCKVDASMPFEKFLPYAKENQEKAKHKASLDDGEDTEALFFVTCVLWVSYTSIIQPVMIPGDSNPRITWGKYFESDGKLLIPVSVLCHHALVDGIHISKFYSELENQLKNM